MFVFELRAALAEYPDNWTVDARIENGAMGDWPISDLTGLEDRSEGSDGQGWVTLILDESFPS